MDFKQIFENLPRLAVVSDLVVVRSPIICNDGTQISVQASVGHYCLPKNNTGPYTHYEIGFPETGNGEPLYEERLQPYKDNTGDVYLYVPEDLIVAILTKHGGVPPWKQKR